MDQQGKFDELDRHLEDQEILDRKLSDKVAKWFDGIQTTPNRLTMLRIVLSLPMSLCFTLAGVLEKTFWYWIFWHVTGALIYVFCALLDFFDGALARYQKRRYDLEELPEDEENKLTVWQRLSLRGSSHFGAILDPFSDKIMYFGAVFPLGWRVVNHNMLFASLGVGLILTIIRFRAIRRALEFGGKGAANRFGKYKMWIEVAAIASLGLLPNGSVQTWCATITIGLALFFGLLSLAGHIRLALKKAAAHRKASRSLRSMR